MAPMSAAPDLSVIVVTYNRSELALRTISSARDAAGEISVEWHVVDSGSSEPVADLIERRWPEIDLHRCANAGFAAANNRALPHARGRYVLLLNPDVEVRSGTLADLVRALDRRPEVGMASVIQLAPDGSLQHSIRRDPSPVRALGEAVAPGRLSRALRLGEVEGRDGRYRRESRADWLCGAFLVARAEVVRQIGPLDERFFLYSEETDWCRRCREHGWEVHHLPVMTVTHHTRRGYGAEQLAQLSYSRVLFARKHLGRPRAGALRAAVALNHLVRLLAFTAGGVLARSGRRGRSDPRGRAGAELRALAVVLGLAPAPWRRSGG